MSPVAITGMHRSGTSMVARVLGEAGLSLGPAEDLLPPQPDNPEGYFESRSMMMVSDRILAIHGGGWDLVPDLPEGWTTGPRVSLLREDVAAALQRFGPIRHWGWKDPRVCVTLPFWRELLPGLKVVVCLRNPVEVATSLHRRGLSSMNFGFDLWERYTRAIVTSTTPGERIVTHYASWFSDPHAELARVCEHIGMRASDDAVAAACANAKPGMRNSSSTLADLAGHAPTAELVNDYLTLCAEAGPVYAPLAAVERDECTIPLPAAGDAGRGWFDRFRDAELERLRAAAG